MSDDQSDQDSGVLHIRRCHVCGGVSEQADAAIHKCLHCGKHLAPFYYFDESKLEGLGEMGPYLSIWKEAELDPGTFNPIWGLSTYWQDGTDGKDSRNEGGSRRHS